LGNLAIVLDGGVDQVGPCDPDWLVVGEIVVPDVLSKPVVHGADWQNVAVGLHEREEPEVRPEAAVEAFL